MAAVLLSGLAYRSVLSTAVLFLVTGFAAGHGGFGLILLQPESPEVRGLADLALFSILFTDGMRISFRDLAHKWRLPGRALLIGLPLTVLGTAVAARLLSGLPWL